MTTLKEPSMNEVMNVLNQLGLVAKYEEPAINNCFAPTTVECVEGKKLLDKMGIAFTAKNWGDKLQRVNTQNGFVEGEDFTVMFESDLMSPTTGGHKKRGQQPKVYAYTPRAAFKAVMSAHTAEGSEFRDKTLDTMVQQSETIQVKDAALTAIETSSNEEHVVELAKAGKTGKRSDVQRAMLAAKPSYVLNKILVEDVPLDVQTKNILADSNYNASADYDSRMRFSNSLKRVIEDSAQHLTNKHFRDRQRVDDVLKQMDKSLSLIDKYQLQRTKQGKTLAESRADYFESKHR